jgi:hypothetical protein
LRLIARAQHTCGSPKDEVVRGVGFVVCVDEKVAVAPSIHRYRAFARSVLVGFLRASQTPPDHIFLTFQSRSTMYQNISSKPSHSAENIFTSA